MSYETGDRAYMAGGDLFVTGRIKDIIIRAGQHIAPHESSGCWSHSRLAQERGRGLRIDPASGTERVVILAEVDGNNPLAEAALKVRAQEAATHIVGGPPDGGVVLVQPGTVPKTASGRRSGELRARDLYLGKNLAVPQRALWWQLARLSFAGLGVRISQVLGTIGQVLYAAWWWTFIAAFFLLGWLAVMTLPRLTWRWMTIRALARAAFAAIQISVSVTGIDRIPRGGAVMAFNHASYVDAVVVAAVLPGEPILSSRRSSR